MFRSRRSLVLLLAALPACGADRIGDIEFFGYLGLDVHAIREALPVREGDAYSDQTPGLITQGVMRAIGKKPTDIYAPCCDDNGNRSVFIGLPGSSARTFTHLPAPSGDDRLPAEIMSLYARLERAFYEAVRKGGGAAGEDDSRGYALINYPPARALQLDLRRWALHRERQLVRVLEHASDATHRRVAVHALGYARRSQQQMLALVRASRDPDDEVRNDATRALGVLARSDARLARTIPAETFIAMLSSEVWTDRNKGAFVLFELTGGRNPALLASIRAAALDSLMEMASWRRSGHAGPSRVILGRVAGIPEDRLQEWSWKGPVEEILRAARGL